MRGYLLDPRLHKSVDCERLLLAPLLHSLALIAQEHNVRQPQRLALLLNV